MPEIHCLPKKRSDIEFILIDNGSTDGTQAMIESEFPYVKYRHLNTNRGVSYARNRGLERARGRFMMILDNDTIASSQAIEGMEYFMEKHPEYGLCGCRLTDPDGTPQDNCKNILVSQKKSKIFSTDIVAGILIPIL